MLLHCNTVRYTNQTLSYIYTYIRFSHPWTFVFLLNKYPDLLLYREKMTTHSFSIFLANALCLQLK